MYLVVLLYQYASKSDTEQTASSATAIMNQMKNETTRVWAKKKSHDNRERRCACYVECLINETTKVRHARKKRKLVGTKENPNQQEK